MKEWIEHEILKLSHAVNTDIDPSLQRGISFMFDWANRMGLEGKKVKGLTLEKPKLENELLTPAIYKCIWKENDD